MIRNAIFRFFNKKYVFDVENKLGYLSGQNNELLQKKLKNYQDVQNSENAIQNLFKLTRASIENPDERQKFDILTRYNLSNASIDYTVNPEHVVLQLDRIQVLQNLKLVEENEKHYDPEIIEFERLKAKVLLEEEGALQKYEAYLLERPYLRKHARWTNFREQASNSFLA